MWSRTNGQFKPGQSRTRCTPLPPKSPQTLAKANRINSSSGVARPGDVNETRRSYLEVLDEFAVIKLGGGAVVGLRQGQVEPHRRPLLAHSLLRVAVFAEATVAGSPRCPGRCLDLRGSAEVEVGLLLQPAFPGLRGRSSCEGREGDKLHFSRFGHLDELPGWTSLRTDGDSEEMRYFAKLLQIGGLKKVSRSSDGCSVPRRMSGPPPHHTKWTPRVVTVGEKLF